MGAQPSVELAELDPGDEGVTLPTDARSKTSPQSSANDPNP